MFWKNFWPVILWAFLVIVFSAIPGDYIPKIKSFRDWLSPDKVAHLIFYGTLMYLLLMGFIRQYGTREMRFSIIIVSFFIGIVFGALIEGLQFFVFVGRSGNIYDFVANVIGCLLGILVFWIVLKKRKRIN